MKKSGTKVDALRCLIGIMIVRANSSNQNTFYQEMGMDIKEEFEKAYKDECEDGYAFSEVERIMLWAAKWAFETAAKEAESFGDFKGRAVALSIRTLAQSLEEKP